MNTLAKTILWIIALPFLAIVAGVVYETAMSNSYRYRMTFEVDMDGRRHIGSGVIQAGLTPKAWWIPQTGGAYGQFKGQAVIVDLGTRGTLFALLTSENNPDYAGTIVTRMFPPARGVITASRQNMQRYQHAGLRTELDFEQLPTLVRFQNTGDPMTVEKVDPVDLAKSFGAGVKLVRVTLETVDIGWWPANAFGLSGVPITRGIEKKLVWIDHLERFRTDPKNTFSSRLPPAIAGLRR